MHSVTELYGRHPDSDIYIVGTGTSIRVAMSTHMATNTHTVMSIRMAMNTRTRMI